MATMKGSKHSSGHDSPQIAQTPLIYNFSGAEPDYKACWLSEPVKERIWGSYTDNPELVTMDRLVREYRIHKQRVQAIVWLEDIEKQEEAAQGIPLESDIEEYFERIDGSYEAAERHVKIGRTSPVVKNSAAVDDEGPDWVELSAKEDAMMLQEFERRMSFNKKQITSMLKTDVDEGLPVDGVTLWKSWANRGEGEREAASALLQSLMGLEEG